MIVHHSHSARIPFFFFFPFLGGRGGGGVGGWRGFGVGRATYGHSQNVAIHCHSV